MCAGGFECRSIQIGPTLIRTSADQPLFTETVSADATSFTDTAALADALRRADGALYEDYHPEPRMCPVKADDRVVQAQLTEFVRLKHMGPVCSDEALPVYAVVVAADGHVACVESQFSLSCL